MTNILSKYDDEVLYGVATLSILLSTISAAFKASLVSGFSAYVGVMAAAYLGCKKNVCGGRDK